MLNSLVKDYSIRIICFLIIMHDLKLLTRPQPLKLNCRAQPSSKKIFGELLGGGVMLRHPPLEV